MYTGVDAVRDAAVHVRVVEPRPVYSLGGEVPPEEPPDDDELPPDDDELPPDDDELPPDEDELPPDDELPPPLPLPLPGPASIPF